MSNQAGYGSITWRAWSDDAFLAVQQEGKPILLTLTATWCHWCHVMDETSYSDPRVIDLVNSRFIPIRVDVDRRPDLSRRYNQGGFPSIAILNDRGELLDGCLYTPPDQMAGFLEQVVADYPNSSLHASGPGLENEPIASAQHPAGNTQDSPTSIVLQRLQELNDPDFGGFGREPKQPPWEGLRFLMALYSRSGEKPLLDMIIRCLDGMKSGLYDSNDGGFFRYSVTRDWKVPHYEKMSVTNANLAVLYLEAYQLTRRRPYKDVAVGALSYLLSTLYDQPKGLIYGSQDASEDYYRLSWKDREAITPKPKVDYTAYAGWNALVAAALTKAYGVLGPTNYLKTAANILEMLWNESWYSEQGMAHLIGGSQEQPAVLEDQVLFLRASLDLYQATGQVKQLHRAIDVVRCIQKLFGAADGGYYDTPQLSTDSNQPLLSEMPVMENSLLAEALATLLCLTGEEEYQVQATDALKQFGAIVPGGSYLGPNKSRRMEEDEEQLFLPAGSAWGRAWDMMARGPVHLVVVGTSSNMKTRNLLRAALKMYAPHRVIQLLDPGQDGDCIASLGFPVRQEPALYACMDGMCLAPITSGQELRTALTARPWATR